MICAVVATVLMVAVVGTAAAFDYANPPSWAARVYDYSGAWQFSVHYGYDLYSRVAIAATAALCLLIIANLIARSVGAGGGGLLTIRILTGVAGTIAIGLWLADTIRDYSVGPVASHPLDYGVGGVAIAALLVGLVTIPGGRRMPSRTPGPPGLPTAADGGGHGRYLSVDGATVAVIPAGGGRTNGLAVASLVLGIIGLLAVGLVAPLAVIFGHVGLSQIRRRGEAGRGMAIAGLVTGYIGVAFLVAWLALIGITLAR